MMGIKMKRLLPLFAVLSITIILSAQGSGTPSTLRVRTDSTNALMVSNATQTPPFTTSVFNNTRLRTDTDGNLVVSCEGCGSAGIVDVQNYGAAGDARFVIDAVSTNTDNTVTSATANFDASRDTGKLVWGAKLTGGPDGSALSVPLGTITSVTNSTTIEVSNAATATNTGIYLVWGTDDTDALKDAFDAAMNTSDPQGPKPTIYFPAGGYIISEMLANWGDASDSNSFPTILGSGSKTTTVIYKPDFDFSSVPSGGGMLLRIKDTSTGHIEGLAITGASYNFGASLKYAFRLTGQVTVKDILVHHAQSSSAISGAGVFINTCGTNEAGLQCILDEYSSDAISGFTLYVGSSNIIIKDYMGWENEGVQIDNNTIALVEGGNFGDHFLPDGDSLQVTSGSKVTLLGTRVRHRLTITGSNTRVSCFSCNLNDVEMTNQSAVVIGSGATFKYSASRLTSWGTGVWLNNSGAAYDLGGNTYVLGSGSGGFTTAAPYGSSVPSAVGLLPTCNTANTSQRNPVNDSSVATWGDTVADMGSDSVLAYCNGTDWTVMGK